MLTSEGFGNASTNPGGCTVSKKCFLPIWAVDWLLDIMAAMPNLRVFLSTAVVNTTVDATTGLVTAVTTVQRTPTPAHPSGYDRLLSAALPDWYAPSDSAFFTKTLLTLNVKPRGVVIEATEFGDVLMTAGLAAAGVDNVAQGMEVPVETSTAYDQWCGQAATICFWLSWDTQPVPLPSIPNGDTTGYPLPGNWTEDRVSHALIWRRSVAADPSDTYTPRPTDVFLINEQAGNDLLNGNVLLPLSAAQAQVRAGAWAGGINLTVLAMAEHRAYAYAWDLLNATAQLYPASAGHVTVNNSAAGTDTGLAKMPYLRESRRAAYGIQQFRLCSNFAAVNNTGPGPAGCWEPSDDADGATSGQLQLSRTGFKWVDTVGIGSYGFDIHHFNPDYCTYPPYLNYSPDPGPSVPYYVPFRALTVNGAPNLLVAGKSMAQTFLANAVTRLHPTEWVTGVAAGAAATLMAANGWDSTALYKDVKQLQALLRQLGSPLDWTGV